MARIELAALDHNYNFDREQATSEGIKRYRVLFPKDTKAWVAKPTADETKSYEYFHEISTPVLKSRSMEQNPIRHHTIVCGVCRAQSISKRECALCWV